MSQFLFFMTVLSFFYFLIISTSSKAFKYYSATKKVQAIKASLLFVTLALIGAWTYFYLTDGDLIADCFGRLNDQDGLTRVIGIVWFGVFSLLIARDVLNYRKRIKLLQSSVLKSRSFRNIGYFEVENSVEPVVAGLWKPQIYIPEGISKNSEALKLILSHEFIHLKNKDGLWSFLNLLIHRLNWHNPMALVSMSQIKIQMEMATDEEAVQEFKLSISDYAGQLVQLITKNQKSSLFMMNMSSTFSQMESRLLNLKNIQNGKMKKTSGFTILILMFLSLGVSEAYASIKQPALVLQRSQMCCEAQSNRIIENWTSVKNKTEPNKCE